MKTTYLLLLSLFLASPVRAESHLSLGEVTRVVLANNPRLKETRRKWEAMKERVPQAAAWEDLKVSAGSAAARFVNISPNGFVDQMVTVEQAVPISGKNRSRARIAAAEAISAFEETRRAELDVVAQTRSAYFQLANAWAQLELNHQNTVSLKQIAEISRSKYVVGNQTAADVLIAEVEANKLVEAQRDLEQRVALQQSALNVLMNRDAFLPLGRPEDDALPSLSLRQNALRALTLLSRPEVRIAQAELEAQKSRLELAHRAWIPDPALSVQGQRYNDTGQAVSEIGAGVSFSIPWSNPRKYSAGVREAKDSVAAAQQALDRTQKEAVGLLRNAIERVETAHHHLDLFRGKLVPEAKQAFEAAQFSYESGKASFLDWISAQRNYRDLEATARAYLADYETALAELESVVGTDLKSLPTARREVNQEAK